MSSDPILIRTFTCLPAVAVEDTCELGSSAIQRLDFVEWLRLEGQEHSGVYDKLQRRYSRNPPAFWRKDIRQPAHLIVETDPESVRALATSIAGALRLQMLALHWFAGT